MYILGVCTGIPGCVCFVEGACILIDFVSRLRGRCDAVIYIHVYIYTYAVIYIYIYML